jgi:hypothetical protein
MPGNCSGCKHWQTLEAAAQREEENRVFGLHEPLGADRESYRVCTPTIFSSNERTLGMATARDASGYLAALFTRAEFGCVQFEPTAPPPTDAR